MCDRHVNGACFDARGATSAYIQIGDASGLKQGALLAFVDGAGNWVTGPAFCGPQTAALPSGTAGLNVELDDFACPISLTVGVGGSVSSTPITVATTGTILVTFDS